MCMLACEGQVSLGSSKEVAPGLLNRADSRHVHGTDVGLGTIYHIGRAEMVCESILSSRAQEAKRRHCQCYWLGPG